VEIGGCIEFRAAAATTPVTATTTGGGVFDIREIDRNYKFPK